MDLQDVEWGGMVWVDLAHVKDSCWTLVHAVINLRLFREHSALCN